MDQVPEHAASSTPGKVVLVTGAGRGIGAATARAFVADGASVMCVSRTEDELVRVAQGSSQARYIAETVATSEGRRRIVDETLSTFGRIDVLVNNAGVGSAKDGPIWDLQLEWWRETLAVNLEAPYDLTRLVSAGMIDRSWGRIVNVSSTAALASGLSPGMSAYASAKHGVLGLTRAVALDLAPYSITCNAVLPGWVRTQLAEESAVTAAREEEIAVDDVWAARAATYHAGRIVTPDEVADTIVFLASERASGISGDAVVVALEGR